MTEAEMRRLTPLGKEGAAELFTGERGLDWPAGSGLPAVASYTVRAEWLWALPPYFDIQHICLGMK